MPTRNVTSGRFRNASEVVRECLRLLEQREREDKAKASRYRHSNGSAPPPGKGFDDIERGDPVTLRSGKQIDSFIDRLGEEASAEFAAGQNRA